ncbi:hypothetical protein Gasu2_35200 [Galdieria sulphuraria]|uniref:Metal ion (Mn2+/Co2+) transporter, MIT family n=1 Tax=Galdieria sulphuraria TaxID=130081 RepID=M2XC03_GALSU|nr:metal ion (Mn2+/Co2+) transporter, MIT family [Galdieria sulphuraria]EME27422.1 metal ion (Mn2+/Co2+) transporter, MIT family [Galdieria sulphuraria]GJD09259.1 hypothetical protein Gasu2_35200 [Galdieria sulphuraria]|eukprot:XP_005703942.1 metal ion (Mn2+/Co2+) transporter, MIT family [Galdieria sulphuraria]
MQYKKEEDSFLEFENLSSTSAFEERELPIDKTDYSALILVQELGKDLIPSSKYISRLELVTELQKYGDNATGGSLFNLRDLRKVDPAFQPNFCLYVVDSILLVNLNQIAAIILPAKVIFLDPESSPAKRACNNVVQLLQNEEERLAFPFAVLEGVILTACLSVEREIALLEPRVMDALSQVSKYSNYSRLAELRLFRQKLLSLNSIADRMDILLEEFFDSDFVEETLFVEKNGLVKREIGQLSSLDDLKCVFEPYLQSLDLQKSICGSFLKALQNVERTLMLGFDFIRNKLFTLDLLGTILILSFTLINMVVGFFGFNLTLPIYNLSDGSQYYFYAIVGGLTVFMLVSIIVTILWMKKKEFLVFHENIHREVGSNLQLDDST